MADTISELRRILRAARTVAVVGLSAEWHRPGYFAARVHAEHDHRMPVNPRYAEVLGGTLLSRAWEAVRFRSTRSTCSRKPDDVPPIARAAMAHRREVPQWQQLGVKNLEPMPSPRAAGLIR